MAEMQLTRKNIWVVLGIICLIGAVTYTKYLWIAFAACIIMQIAEVYRGETNGKKKK